MTRFADLPDLATTDPALAADQANAVIDDLDTFGRDLDAVVATYRQDATAQAAGITAAPQETNRCRWRIKSCSGARAGLMKAAQKS